MANFQIPAPPSDKRPKNTYEWFGAIIKSLQDTKGVNWNVNNTLNIKELGNSIGNDKNFVSTVDRKILDSRTPIKLAPNTDLNTLTNNGIYTSDSDNNSQTLVNRPPGTQSFILRVYRIWSENESRYRTIQIAYNRTTGFMYSRGKSESTDWTNWVGSLYTTDATSTNSANKLVIRDNSGNFSAGTITASLNGNASTATKLQTANTINGTAFDGSKNIITNQWGTQRTLTIGNSGKPVNGSTNVTWSLAEIGALPLAGGIISSSSFGPLTIERTGNPYSATIGFKNTNGILGYIGMTDSINGGLIRFSADTLTQYKVLDTGNFKSHVTPSAIGAAAASHTHTSSQISDATNANTSNMIVKRDASGNFSAGTITATLNGTATYANYMNSNTRMEYGWNGVNYFNISGTAGNAAKANDTPTTAWWHIMRFNHANSSGFYTDLAIPFNDVSLHYKRVTSGAVQNGGWIKVLDSLNYTSFVPTKTGSGASGTWGISINGNASTATKLATARKLTIGSTGKIFDGTTDVNWSLSEIGALPLAGGTMSGDIQMNERQIRLTTVNSGYARIGYEPSTKDVYISNYNNNWLRIKSDATMTIGGHKIYAANNKPTSNDISDATNDNTVNKIVKRDGSGNFSAGTITASLNGNASTATTLQNNRTINGTTFNGSKDITTNKWGVGRNITIGSKSRLVDGSTDLTWTLNDIGAAPTTHGHTSIGSRGMVTAESGTQRPAVDGISMSHVYNNGYPISYGNVLTLSGGGKSQLLIGWGGNSGAHEKAYIRSKRDMDSALWSEWAQIYTSAHKPTPADIGALAVSGGQLTGNLTFSNSGTTLRGIEGIMAENDGWRVMGGGTANDAGYLEIATCDNGNEPIYVRQYTGTSSTTSFTTLVRSATLLDGNGNTHFPGTMHVGGKRLAGIASHGGLDVGDSSIAISLCSKNQPIWYDGSNTRELVYSVKDSGGYPCMMSNNNGWIRTPPSGIIPNTSGTGGGRSSLGSQTWTFSSGYINEVYCTGITSVGDLWLTAKNANGYIISQGHIKPSGTAIKYLGESANRWHSVWAANGTIQTSDERFKVKQGLTNIEECFDMIKNTNIYNYIMIGQNKEDLSKNRLGKLAMEHNKIDSNIHMGVMAQDILAYNCARQIIIEDEYERLDGTTDTMLSINPYNLTSALMGALKVEISKREELETTVSELKDELTELKELVKSFLNK